MHEALDEVIAEHDLRARPQATGVPHMLTLATDVVVAAENRGVPYELLLHRGADILDRSPRIKASRAASTRSTSSSLRK